METPSGTCLTLRLEETLSLIAKGLTNPEIAEMMGISVKTVEGNVEKLLLRLNVSTRTQAAVWWAQHNNRGTRQNAE